MKQKPQPDPAPDPAPEAEGGAASAETGGQAVDYRNTNVIFTDGWSNRASLKLYRLGWPGEPGVREKYEAGFQCGGCTFFAKFGSDFGLCGHPQSRHFRETVFEHFTCSDQEEEGWGPHSFTKDRRFHCSCRGGGGGPRGQVLQGVSDPPR